MGQPFVRNCKRCGAPITFIRTKKGKAMPCDAYPIPYRKEDDGPENIMTPQGELVRGSWVDSGENDGMGYRPHWAKCQVR